MRSSRAGECGVALRASPLLCNGQWSSVHKAAPGWRPGRKSGLANAGLPQPAVFWHCGIYGSGCRRSPSCLARLRRRAVHFMSRIPLGPCVFPMARPGWFLVFFAFSNARFLGYYLRGSRPGHHFYQSSWPSSDPCLRLLQSSTACSDSLSSTESGGPCGDDT